MALALMLAEAGLTADKIEPHAAVTLDKFGDGLRSRKSTECSGKDSGRGQ
jgi:osmotically inducible protein OsmC